MSSSLCAVLDGDPLPPDEARDLWTRFSAYMDENQGDFAGFAAALGFVEAKVGMVDGQPTLQLRSKGGAAGASKTQPSPAKRTKPKRGKAGPAPTPPATREKPRRPKRKKSKREDRGVDIGDVKPTRPRRKS